MRIEKPEENKEKVEEKSVSTSIEQEVIDQYYDYVEYGGELPIDAVYMTADDFGIEPAKAEMILRKNGIYESVEEKKKKKDDKAEEKKDYDDEQGDVPGEQDTGPDEYDEREKEDNKESVEEKEDKKDGEAKEKGEKDSDKEDDDEEDDEDEKDEKEEKSCDSKKKESTIIEVEEDISLPGTDIMLEKGDRIKVLSESLYMPIIVAINNYLNDNKDLDWRQVAVTLSRSIEDGVTKNPTFGSNAYNILTKIGIMLK